MSEPTSFSVPPGHPVGAPLPGRSLDRYRPATFTVTCEWNGADDCHVEHTVEYMVYEKATDEQRAAVGWWHLGKLGWTRAHGHVYCQPCWSSAVESGVFDD